MIKRIVYELLPTPLRIQGIRTYSKNVYLDLADSLGGRNDRELPPRRLNVAGEGSFRALGDHNLSLCREFGHLTAEDTVLDLGCGIGRTALAMASFLRPPGRYVGLDIIRFAIRWCQRHISSTHPQFRFIQADVFNRMYNPGGKFRPEEFSFPFEAQSFSFCLASSLFTHLLPPAVERYVKEVSRVLTIDGSFTSTWFLIAEETRASMAAGLTQIAFPHRYSHYAQHSLHAPEQAVAFELDYVRSIYARAGLTIESIHFGGWSGAAGAIDSGQDLIVARRLS